MARVNGVDIGLDVYKVDGGFVAVAFNLDTDERIATSGAKTYPDALRGLATDLEERGF
jgi:hypothetical protein